MSSAGAAPCAAASLSPARADASRRNGAKSKGPKTPEGKARSSQNALKHGLRAQKHMVLPGESAAEYKALEAALLEELAPEGALQSVLAQRVVAASWRLARAERLEAEIFAREMEGPFGIGDLGQALSRDCNGARSFDTLLRYRGGTLAELWRALRTLKALQAERAEAPPEPVVREPRLTDRSLMRHKSVGNASLLRLAEPRETPVEPESRATAGESEPAPHANEPAQHPERPAPVQASEPEPSPAIALALQCGPQPDEPKGEATAGQRARLERDDPRSEQGRNRDTETLSPQLAPSPKGHWRLRR